MYIKEWKVAVALLCGLGICVAGVGGFALRLSPRAAAVTAVPAAEEDECEEVLPPTEGSDTEA